MSVIPTVLSMLLCDNVHKDATTGKLYILGTFSVLASPQFPATFPIFFVCVALTDGAGEIAVRLQVVDATIIDPDPIVAGTSTVAFPDRFAVLEAAFPFPNVTFPHPGEYRVQLLADGVLLLERRVVLMDSAQPPTEEGQV